MILFSRVLLLSLALGVATVRAQQTPQQALEAANNTYNNGDYPAAVEAYEAVLRDYPTSPVVPNAQVQLAFSCYLTGENQQSLDILKKFFEGPPAPAELTELAAYLEPQVLSAVAASLKPEDPARKKNFEEAVKKFAAFIQKYPQSAELESAYYGSAIASFQIGDYAAAKATLDTNLKRFANSPGILDSQNLLALIFATEGSKMLGEEGADKNAAFALYAKSAELLRGIIEKKTDLALVNSARFQLGEILLNEAAFAPEERKPALLEEARDAFRGVLPKDEIIALQKKKIDGIPALRRTALAARDNAALRRIDRQAERDRRKLAELEARPDQTVTALQKIGESYFQGGRYDESRVILAHAEPLLTDDEDKKRNLYYLAMTYAVQNAAEPAVARYDAFQRAHKGDPIAANLPVAMGNLFLAHPDPALRDPEKAAKYFKEAAEIYPKSPFLGLSVVNEATARAQQGDFDGALKTYRDFLATNPPPEVGAVAQLGIGLRSLLAAKQMELAAEIIDAAAVEKYFEDLAASAPEGAKSKILFARAAFISEKDPARALEEMNKAYDASLVYAPSDLDLYGLALLENGQADQAKAVFEKIAVDYPNPTGQEPAQAPPAIQEAQAISIFGLGRVAQEQGDIAGAGTLFEKLKSLYPWSPKVLEANYGIADSLRSQGKTDEAIALLTQIIRAPNAPTELRANSMLLGGYIQKDKGERDAAIDYFIKISAFYEGVPEAAAAGLWEGGQLLELQVADLQTSDPEKAQKQQAQVLRAYKELTEKFPDSELAPKARERLSALGGQ